MIGSVAGPPQHRRPMPSLASILAPYEPPTAKLPDAPEVPGKWLPEYTRDHKKYVVPGLDGIRQTETFTRATSHAKVLDDMSNLTDWQLRGTVMGLALNPELLDKVDTNGAGHISELDFRTKLHLSGIVNKAMRSVGGHDGSDFGTKLHGYLQAVLEGVIAFEEVPEVLRPYLEVVFAAMRKHGYSFVQGMVERTVFIPATGMVGTFDFLALSPEGELLIGDLKTSSSIDWSWLSIGIQLAQYANAEAILAWDGSHWQPMPPISKVYGIVASVPKDDPVPACRLYVVDLNLGTEMMDLATRVKAVHESALRCASNIDQLRDTDELIACAIAEPLTLSEARTPALPAA